MLIVIVTLQAATLASIESCTDLNGPAGIAMCLDHARKISSNHGALLQFANELEAIGATQKSLAVYKLAYEIHPRSRPFLENYLRLRRQEKAVALVSDHFQDVAVMPEQTVSQHTAMTVQVNSASEPVTDSETLSKAGSGTEANTPPLVQKLQLLKELFQRQLIDKPEFERRRARLLGEEFGSADKHSTTPPTTASSGTYHALIIGNDRYENFVRLRSPVNDARVVDAVLRNRYGFKSQVLINATRYDILSALSKLRREIKEQDSLLIYYAGHGFLDDKTRRGYWLPVDAERDNVANWIPTTDITDSLAGVAARHALVVADSCFSGALLREAHTDPRAELLQRLANRKSRTVLTSGGLEPVLDDGDGKHSIFARVFLDALRENQGVLETGRLFLQLRDRVTLNAQQTPQYAPIRNAGHEGGDFIFVRQ